MEILHSVKQVQHHLRQHDKAVEQIKLLDDYLTTINDLAFYSAINSNYIKVMRLMLRKSIAEGVRKMLKIYRLRKWFAAQSYVRNVTQTLSRTGEFVVIPDIERLNVFPHIDQPYKEDVAARSWVVMECELYRTS